MQEQDNSKMSYEEFLLYLWSQAEKDFSNITPEFLEMFSKLFGMSDYHLALIFHTDVLSIAQKRQKVSESLMDILNGKFIDTSSMTIDEQIAYYREQQDLMASSRIKYNKDQWQMWKDIISDLHKQSEAKVEEGQDLLVKILSFFKLDLIPQVKDAFNKAISNLKKEIAYKIFNYMWKTFKGEDSNEAMKEDMLNTSLLMVEAETQIQFEISDLFVEACNKNSTVRDEIDKYLQGARKTRYVGGSAVKQEDSLTGGKTYEMKRKHEGKNES